MTSVVMLLGRGGGYSVLNSLRFRSSASAYLNRTPSVAGSQTTWTWSGWVKRGSLGINGAIFSAYTSATTYYTLQIQSNDTLQHYNQTSSSITAYLNTTQVFRDPSAWYHIVAVYNSTNATASNRMSLYVNGVQVTAFSTATYPTQNTVATVNSTSAHYISQYGAGNYFDGYLAEVNFIDGQALTPSSFGTYDANGVWQPIKYSGSFGTNGFYLNFGNTTSTTTLGYDTSGNSNNWTANNINVTSNSYRSFTASGANGWTAPAGVTSVTYLVVGGGGGGGSASATGTGGGGGAGGFLTGTATVTPGTTYTITVGAGGAASSNGSNSSISGTGLTTITAIGGGAGGVWNSAPGQTGGSGGGGAAGGGGGANLSAGSGTSGQGNAGGAGSTSNAPAGGGGGAGAVGGTGTSSAAGSGGIGLQSSITGSAVYYAGGGGGAAAGATAGSGGLGGGGGAGVAGTANTGGGGGGASPSATGSAGGSGIVILSYSGALQVGTTYDSMTDSPTVSSASVTNYAVLSPIDKSSSLTLTNGNLQSSVATTWQNIRATFGITSGIWYWEYTMTATGLTMIGIGTSSVPLTGGAYLNAGFYGYYSYDGSKWNNNVNASYGNSFTTNDVISVAFDASNGKIWFAKNGIYQASGVPTSGTNPAYSGLTATPYFPMVSQDNSLGTNGGAINFGQQPFVYTPPTGFNALNTYNLPTPTIANGAQYMAATTYTGTGASLTIANSANNTIGTTFQPDFVWLKSRSAATDHALYDVVRGTTKDLVSNTTAAETTQATGLTAFGSTGFTIGALAKINTSAATYVGWQWLAGNSSGVSNTNGSITSTVSANTTAGFSVVTWTGTGANATIGHGLGVAPSMLINKFRSTTSDWPVYHISIGAGNVIYLNTTAASVSSPASWNNTAPTSSVFSVGAAAAPNGTTMVTYCFAAVAGYSAFGSYTGNGSSDGPFIYTGFRPRFVLYKRTDATGSWNIIDTSRLTYNLDNLSLQPDNTGAEITFTSANSPLDILSNGFKLRGTGNDGNVNAGTYVYAVFAENPFNSSRAR